MFVLFNLYDITQGIPPDPLAGSLCIVMVCKDQGSHKLWKSWKITKKSSMHGKIMEFDKEILNNYEKNHRIL